MGRQTGWQFLDDRGHLAATAHTPARVVAYIQAGATLFDHGLCPVGLFGSRHDGENPDTAKAGSLPLADIAYLGSGSALDTDALLRAAPDLVVAVTYGGGQVYGIDAETAKHVEERVPLAVIDVGQGRSLGELRDRFTELARSLGAATGGPAEAELDRAAGRLRDAAGAAAHPRILALSPAGPDSVHLARPPAWPDLRELTELGSTLAEPPSGPGTGWSTTGWGGAQSLEPDIILTDIRGNAYPVDELRGVADWQALEARARLVPWNPEVPCSLAAHARFLHTVADAVEAFGDPRL
ncbi:ABC transporter substrate-binding protein [Streptomyces sp. NPDC051219]|uniref:ABC transporter substrate-binding protein n=1 Tax=Streptomyces sp. NPDC051219 TaxID=3155283 RepID=UPI003433077F